MQQICLSNILFMVLNTFHSLICNYINKSPFGSMELIIVLCCIALHCIVLYCTVLYCIDYDNREFVY